MNAIEVNNVGMSFNLPTEKIHSIKEHFIKRMQKKIQYNEFIALENISFCIEQGDAVAIIGDNGSGKSTLLKLIAGVYKPTIGSVSTYGKIAPMIELGAGFDSELTARENIFLNGTLLGHSQSLLNENLDSIIKFAELEDFIDVEIKNYSSGMVARLAFAIATFSKPDILICDEILSVGDYKFQEKSSQRITSLLSQKTTLLLVSHSYDQVKSLCSKALYLKKGNMVFFGDIEEAYEYYHES